LSPIEWTYVGGTIDDAAGEAFDKVAVMLGLPFPGGPALSKLAEMGNPRAISFPRPLLEDKSRLDFSFSGLKTAVRYRIAGTGKQNWAATALEPQLRADIAASFQQAIIDCLIGKSLQTVKKFGMKRLCLGGGVAANRALRQQIAQACEKAKIELHVAPPELCTDNAVMGALAWEKIKVGQFDTLELDARPGLLRRC